MKPHHAGQYSLVCGALHYQNQTSISPMSFLHIAQKNSIAKQVANILSRGSRRTGETLSRFNPVFHFRLNEEEHTFSSVRGHLFDTELPPECKSWHTYDNRKILTREVEMIISVNRDMQDLKRNLERLARGKRDLVLWLDCDREGEAIAFEVIKVITAINPRLRIHRARFAAVTRTDILNAYSNLVQPNQLEADAVNFRIEIDFRMGCTFTRYQTTTFQRKFALKEHSVISYGPCQMPTLGFVVQRFLQIKYFKPEKYWVITASILLGEEDEVELKWERGTCKDQVQANIMFHLMVEKAHVGDGQVHGRVLQRNQKDKKRYRPYPLTTVAFQKLATDKLKLSSAQAMKIAEKLYQAGMISYPRTETNAFPNTMNLPSIISRFDESSTFSNYAVTLLGQGKYKPPKVGSQNDQAHSPIHPVKSVERNSLSAQEWRVYDLIVRHFLACCSRDAIGVESEVVCQIGDEYFKASHLTIKERNYLEIYPFDKWTQSKFPGEIPEEFEVAIGLDQRKTKPPSYLSESDLITLMEKNQIGTDATIHEHIETIQNRRYAVKTSNTFKPTNLGAALIVTYKELGSRLENCHIRRMIEARMNRIAEGQESKEAATRETLEEVTPIFDDLKANQEKWIQEMEKALNLHQQLKMVEMEGRNQRSNEMQGLSLDDDDDDSRPGPPGPPDVSMAHSRPNSLICYTCGKAGHLSTQCPDRNRQQNRQRPPGNQREFKCLICQQKGHFAPDCPQRNNQNRPPNNGGSYSNFQSRPNRAAGGFQCYNCGEEGHFANQCPNGRGGGNQGGHNNRGNHKSFNKFNSRSHQVSNRNRSRSNDGDKVCSQCGVQGRHPRGTNCPKVRGKSRQ